MPPAGQAPAEVPSPEAIIRCDDCAAELRALAADDPSAAALRARLLERLKQILDDGRSELQRRLDAGAGGTEMVRSQCYLIDQLVRLVYDYVTEVTYPLANPSTGELLSLVAVGGYGRGEMAPYSDVDLLFLLPYKMTPRSEQVVEEILYLLWDLGLKVGHATRTVDDSLRQAKSDVTICTSLLESRRLCGDAGMAAELKRRFQDEVQNGRATRFVEAKLTERAERHARTGGSRYVLEPNIKDGKGGLRDLHTLFWIAKFIYLTDDITTLVDQGVFTKAELRRFLKAQDFLWRLRCHLHSLAGRAEERLTFDLQKEIAPRLGYQDHAGTSAVERFMKHYFLIAKDVGDLTRIFCAALEAAHNRRSRFRLPALKRRRSVGGFRLDGDRLNVRSADVFVERPIDMLRIFHVAQQHDLDIHPEALRWITQKLRLIDKNLRADPKANALFMEMLTSEKDPEIVLRRMSEAGVLGRFIPDFGRVVAQMQYNMYHHYTVDEHTIFAIGILHDIEQGKLKEEAPIASEVVHKLVSRRVLYLAVFLHDICKGRSGDHSVLGEKVAQRLGPRLGLSAAETESVAWLVRHHLNMSDTAFKRDLDDPTTIRDFADLVQSPERLRLLLVLTVADIRAVGPGTWTAWKAALLRQLYWRTEEVLSGSLAADSLKARVAHAKEDLRAALAHWPQSEITKHIRRGYPAYWTSLDTETHVRHAEMVREAERSKAPLSVDSRIDRYRQLTEITIYAVDHPGLFSRLAGAMAVVGASITQARIYTLSNGMALDSFYVEDAQGGPFDKPTKLARLSAAIEQSLAGRLRPLQELERAKSAIPSRFNVFKVPPRVLIDNRASRAYSVIEVNGRDHAGFLYKVTNALTKLNVMIMSARIATYGERAVDVFYVQDALGSKIESPQRLRAIEQKILQALGDPACRAKPNIKSGKTAKTEKAVKGGRKTASKPPARGKTAAARKTTGKSKARG